MVIVGLAAFVAAGYFIGEATRGGGYAPPGNTQVEPPATPPAQEVKPPETVARPERAQQEAQPPSVLPANIAGRWADEVTGTGLVVTYADIYQQGGVISGVIWAATGARAGTFSGVVQGTGIAYDYVAVNGLTGTGRGTLRADGVHIDLAVRDNVTGNVERHTLHRGHDPH